MNVNNTEQHTNCHINRNVAINNVVRNFNNTTVDKDRNVSQNIRAGVDYYLNKKIHLAFYLQ